MLGKLKDNHAKKLIVSFDGSGDDGEIYDIETVIDDTYYAIGEFLIPEDVDFLRDECYDFLCKTVETSCDWVNNEGGFGQIFIDVETQSFTVDYNQRTTEEYSWSDQKLFK